MKITMVNFEKFNPRNDLKSMPWLRLQNNFYELEDFYDADIKTTWLFIFLLCQCAQKVSKTINLDEKYLIFKSKMNKTDFHSALSSLSDKGLILLDTNESDRVRTDSCLTNITNITNRTDRTIVHERSFDLDLIYNAYPKKAGKAGGMKKLKALVKNQEQFDLILQGAKNYRNYCESIDQDQKYIKQFSTWVNGEHWNDEYESVSLLEKKLLDLEAKFIADFGG